MEQPAQVEQPRTPTPTPVPPPPTTPPPPVVHTADQFIGTWFNDDVNTSGITRVMIDMDGPLFVHPFGKCHPTDCDWGTLSVNYTGEPVVVVFNFGGGLVHTISMSLLDPAGTRLQVVDNSTAGGVHTYTFHR